ncbi:MAG: ribose-phosphate diphosphokinase [Alphaproteobacteria bacterium]|nr:ribose-phosphate diphosphokinase [Alphaproteobacteria bacterium]
MRANISIPCAMMDTLLLAMPSVAHLEILSDVDYQVTTYPDDTYDIHLKTSVLGKSVYVVHAMHNPTHNNLIQLVYMCRLLKQKGAQSIRVFLTYCAYLRQAQTQNHKEQHLMIKLISDMLNNSGITEMAILDPHVDILGQYTNFPIYSIPSLSLFQPMMTSLLQSLARPLIVSPDAGSHHRAENFSRCINADAVTMHKERDPESQIPYITLNEDVKGRNCIIVDDMLATGQTLQQAAQTLKSHGAQSIYAIVTHALCLQPMIYKNIDILFVSNSVLIKHMPRGVAVHMTYLQELISHLLNEGMPSQPGSSQQNSSSHLNRL